MSHRNEPLNLGFLLFKPLPELGVGRLLANPAALRQLQAGHIMDAAFKLTIQPVTGAQALAVRAGRQLHTTALLLRSLLAFPSGVLAGEPTIRRRETQP